MTITIGQHTFDRVRYDAEGDVLALHKGEPSTATDFEESPEGDALRFNAAGELVGITILNARHRLERDGHVSVTLPPQQLDAGHDTLDAALVAA